MNASILMDIDHLLANPIFDPNRCSVGFHTLHSLPAILVYACLWRFSPQPWIRLLSAGFLIHIGIDLLDCLFMRTV